MSDLTTILSATGTRDREGEQVSRNNRRKKQRADQTRRAQQRYPALDLESPEVVAARTALTRLIPSRRRIEDRANEARKFEEWRVNPSYPEPGSPNAVDDNDAAFPESIIKHVSKAPLQDHALFPAMAAAENLTTVVRLIDDWDRNGKVRTLSVITLCRAALESSSRTVWLLSPTSPTERHERALRMTKAEVLGQKRYLAKQVNAYKDSTNTSYLETVTADLKRATKVIDDLDEISGAPTNEQFIEQASAWVDETAINPQHSPMADMARPMYSIASGLAHGYTWTTKHMRGAGDLFSITADFLYASTSMLSAAVILWETQAAATENIGDRCPPHLRAVARDFHARYAN
uniref:hypothetical protein n=1 Tax=Gordonia sp. B7-2 TaxID=3420932 RepID=UPI003D94E467